MKLELDRPCPPESRGPRVARLTRHLEARLLDFGPGGPQVLDCDPAAGRVCAQFPGHDAALILAELTQRGISAALEGACAVFYLSPAVRFEDLDRVWGLLYDLL